MSPAINLKTVSNNVGWSVLAKTTTFGLKFVTVPLLARILSPAEFGAVAVAHTVVIFLTMVGSAGLAASLVVRRDLDAETLHSVFWANLLIACALATGLYVWAEFFAEWLGAADAALLVRVMAFLIPIQLCGDVAYALLARNMAFGKDATWSVVSEVIGAVTALGLALLGWGVWALVAQLFISALIRLAGLLYASRYRPRLVMSLSKLAKLMKFSLGVMGSEIFNFITFQSPLVIISRHLGLADAGAYSAANRFSSIPNQVLQTALMGVLFPAFSHMNDDRARRSEALMLSTQVSTVFLAPMMFGIWAIAEPGMLLIFGPQWAYAWPILGLLALSKGILTPCSTFIPYLKGAGQSSVLWWVAVARAILVYGFVTLGVMAGGLEEAMILLCIANALTLVGYSWAVFRTDGTPFLSGLYVTSRPMITALVMALAIRSLLDHIKDDVPSAALQVVICGLAGSVFYAALVLLTERELVRKLLQLARQRLVPEASLGPRS